MNQQVCKFGIIWQLVQYERQEVFLSDIFEHSLRSRAVTLMFGYCHLQANCLGEIKGYKLTFHNTLFEVDLYHSHMREIKHRDE